MNYFHPIFTEKTECQDCYKCLRECPVKAIKITDGHAEVIDDMCMLCGHCVQVCPVHAKKVRNDLGRAKQLLALKKRVFVSIAPSYVSEFPDITPAQLVQACMQLGFCGVSETALGAEQVSANVSRLMNNDVHRLCISSACPTVVEFITKYRPEFADEISPMLSPVLTHAKMLKAQYGHDIGVVFLGPCIAKKREADRHPDLLDLVLTFDELRQWLGDAKIDITTAAGTDTGFVPYAAKEGALYPIDGGMVAGIKANVSVHDRECMSFSGMQNIMHALDGLEGTGKELPFFLELLACDGGCVNGPVAASKAGIVLKRYQVIKDVTYSEEAIPRTVAVTIDDVIQRGAVHVPTYPDEDIVAVLRTIGKVTERDELNCGGCGYDTCRSFARSVLDNKAESTMCVSYMRKLAQKKANALISAMPSGVVIVNKALKIVECNRNFARILGADVEAVYGTVVGLENAVLQKVVPFYDVFQQVLDSGADVLNRDVQFKDTILHVTVFTIEKKQLVGGVIQDITTPVVRKQQVIDKAEAVIRKNLETVQKIAYLLGENAAESEVLLNAIIQSFGLKKGK